MELLEFEGNHGRKDGLFGMKEPNGVHCERRGLPSSGPRHHTSEHEFGPKPVWRLLAEPESSEQEECAPSPQLMNAGGRSYANRLPSILTY